MKLIVKTPLTLSVTGFVCAVLYLVLLCLRFYQVVFLIDDKTGYFLQDSITIPIVYGSAIALVFLSIILCYICGKLPTGELNKKRNALSVILGFVFSGALFYQVYSTLSQAIDFSTLNQLSIPLLKQALGSNSEVLTLIFAFISGFVILIETIVYASGKGYSAALNIPMLFPVLWAFFKTLSFFSVTVSYIKVSQLMFVIFSYAFFMLFLFENARMSSGIGRKTSVWFFFATGIITVGLGICAFLPTLILNIADAQKTINMQAYSCEFDIAFFAGIFYTVGAMYKRDRCFANSNDNTAANAAVTETE